MGPISRRKQDLYYDFVNREEMNVFHVQSLLGHSSLTMTRIYAEQVNSEDAVKAYKAVVR